MQTSKIEWVLNPDNKTLGWTWNPLTGCLNHTPEGLCLGGRFPCYAWRLANGRLKMRYLANHNCIGQDTSVSLDDVNNLVGIVDPCDDPFYPRLWAERLSEPIRGYHKADWFGVTPDAARERGIFVCDMSDLFGIGIPQEWTQRVMDTIKKCPQDRFYLLTKQPQNLSQFNPFPDNAWVGVTATNQKAHNEAVVVLSQIEANTKFISHEPLLENVSLHSPYSPEDAYDWDIIGAQTKPAVYPKKEWVDEIVMACDRARISVFLKDNLKPLIGDYLRQEMP